MKIILTIIFISIPIILSAQSGIQVTGSASITVSGSADICADERSGDNFSGAGTWCDGPLIPAATVIVKIIPDGFYNTATGMLNLRDTITAYLSIAADPYSTIDSAKGILDSISFTSELKFENADDGQYYIVINHRNSLETWSKSGGETYIRGVSFDYDFTSANAQTYANNSMLKDGKWCIYSGDVNQDGVINAVDRAMTWNERNSTGYQAEDVNGDGIVNAVDRGITWNNRNKSIQRPIEGPEIRKELNYDNKSKIKNIK